MKPFALTSLVWLFSEHDDDWHAFDSAQLADDTIAILTATCGHSVPRSRTAKSIPARMHRACIVLLGEHMPAGPDWHM
jgi:hypothetical protein